jgi:dephospho-CoA kinase
VKVIGITGGIGSGKSVVSKLLEINGIPVYNSDVQAKILNDTSPIIREKLSAQFGKDLYSEGRLNRQRLSEIIFNNPENLAFVNAVIHPEVRNHFLLWKEKTNKSMVGIESAILFESGFDDLADVSVNVSAPEEIRIQRVQKRDNLSRPAILQRISNQFSDTERNRLATFTIVNDDRQAIIPQIEKRILLLKN